MEALILNDEFKGKMIFEKIEITKESFLSIRKKYINDATNSAADEWRAIKGKGSKFYYYTKHSVGRLYTKEGEKCYAYAVDTIEGLNKSIVNYWKGLNWWE